MDVSTQATEDPEFASSGQRPSRAGTKSRRHDIALYAPLASTFYGASGEQSGGGAERQAFMLARGLSLQGFSVAHIVYPISEPRAAESPFPTIVERGGQRTLGKLSAAAEVATIWKALRRADAAAYVFRGASAGHLTATAAFCRTFQRTLVFSGSSDLDFDLRRPDRHRLQLSLYRLAMGWTDRVVAQTEQQLELACRAFPSLRRPTVIPSFAQAGESEPLKAEAFLWVDRLVDYKRPHLYVRLAEALPEARFRMVIPVTSETPPGMLEHLHAAADRLHNLELVAPKPRPELMDLIRRSVAIVSTSLVEGMPNTFLEAWARGVPVLTHHVDPDGVVSGNGLGIAACGSWEGFVEGAEALWRDPSLRANAAQRGRLYIERVHSPEAVVKRWTELLSDVLPPRLFLQ